jgi:uroporphyrinogen-III decarboxylase
MGGLGQRTTLHRGTPEEVTKEAREALHETGGTALLLAPGCSVPPGARQANLVAMMKAVAA